MKVRPLFKKKPPMGERGVSGLVEYNGYVHEEFLRDLQGTKAVEKYREMWWNSPVVSAMVRAITMQARQVEWWFDAAETDTSEEVKKFVEGALDDMSTTWHDILAAVLQGIVVFGWDFREIVYKMRLGLASTPGKSSKFDDGKVGWRKFAERSQDSTVRWEFDEGDGELRGMWQRQKNMTDVFIPLDKALLFRAEKYKASPEGLSMLRSAYRPWYYAKRLEEVEAVGAERDLNGLPVMEVPAEITLSDATSDQKAAYAAAKDLVQNVRINEQAGIVLPQAYDEDGHQLYKFELLSASSRKNYDTDTIIKRYSSQIAMSVLADFLTLGHEGVGSFALSEDKTTMFSVAMGTLNDGVASVFNRHATPRLLELNGIPIDRAPVLKHGTLDTSSLGQDAEALVKLGNGGMMVFPNEALEDYLYDKGGFPPVDQETRDELLRAKEEDKEQMKQRLSERAQVEGTPAGGKNE